ncbi:MAG: CehA/McbA family metallohydrolase [Methanobacteriota archaeon]|nr:MAG: CehA/McbA family metallohydrolase [Euryarchaeota archaeon]
MACPLLTGQALSEPKADKGKPTGGYNLYFGDLHTHTNYSDGSGVPEEAYAMAIKAGADFMAITDHTQIWNAYEAWVADEEEWELLKAAAESYTSKKFVAMAGYEAWLLANCGELNVYNVPDLPPFQTLGYRYDRLANFYDWLAEQPGGVAQFNHPLYVSEDFMDYDFITPDRDAGVTVIEVHNEDYYEPSYIKALDAGWHIMPAANSDTHYPDWIQNHSMRTVLLAESLTPDDLYDAIRERRGYGTLDKNLEIRYTLNDAVMGSILTDTGVTEYTASIQINDPDGAGDEITKVEIISDGGAVVASVDTSGSSVDLTINLESEDARYFYVRVTTMSPLDGKVPGVTAWTSPVWTGR